ncbi:MAG: PhoU domain-containing protein, partial [Planctomycetota bacterium]|nr:PhoU domain-containing protein [Planctomycetota bacterium]
MLHEHTVKTYEEDLKNLKAKVQQLGRLASEQLERAMGCVTRPREEDCARVVRDDAELDRLEREIDADVLRILALRQPMAVDLREIVAALRIAVELERIGDLASNIAKRSAALEALPLVPPVGGLPDLGRQVGRRLER